MKKLAEQIALALRPLIKQLLAVERDALGIDAQLGRVGVGHVGVEEAIDPVQRALDRRFERITGVKSGHEFVGPEEVRKLLDTIGGFFAAFDVTADTAQLPTDFRIWTDDPEHYDEVAAPHGGRRTIPRYELVGVTATDLRPDGSLKVSRKRR